MKVQTIVVRTDSFSRVALSHWPFHPFTLHALTAQICIVSIVWICYALICLFLKFPLHQLFEFAMHLFAAQVLFCIGCREMVCMLRKLQLLLIAEQRRDRFSEQELLFRKQRKGDFCTA